jgi:hypothetical protein
MKELGFNLFRFSIPSLHKNIENHDLFPFFPTTGTTSRIKSFDRDMKCSIRKFASNKKIRRNVNLQHKLSFSAVFVLLRLAFCPKV